MNFFSESARIFCRDDIDVYFINFYNFCVQVKYFCLYHMDKSSAFENTNELVIMQDGDKYILSNSKYASVVNNSYLNSLVEILNFSQPALKEIKVPTNRTSNKSFRLCISIFSKVNGGSIYLRKS